MNYLNMSTATEIQKISLLAIQLHVIRWYSVFEFTIDLSKFYPFVIVLMISISYFQSCTWYIYCFMYYSSSLLQYMLIDTPPKSICVRKHKINCEIQKNRCTTITVNGSRDLFVSRSDSFPMNPEKDTYSLNGQYVHFPARLDWNEVCQCWILSSQYILQNTQDG